MNRESIMLSEQNIIIEKLLSVKKKCLATLSGFEVACVLKDVYGEYHTGCNLEFKNRSLGICAEGNALSSMLSNFGARMINEIWLMASQQDSSDFEFIVPCGICLQRLAELCIDDTKLVITDRYKVIDIIQFKNLLPYEFTYKKYGYISECINNEILKSISINSDQDAELEVSNLLNYCFFPDESHREAVVLKTISGKYIKGVYFNSSCHKADICAIDSAIYNLFTNENERNLEKIYYASINHNYEPFIHPIYRNELGCPKIIKLYKDSNIKGE